MEGGGGAQNWNFSGYGLAPQYTTVGKKLSKQWVKLITTMIQNSKMLWCSSDA